MMITELLLTTEEVVALRDALQDQTTLMRNQVTAQRMWVIPTPPETHRRLRVLESLLGTLEEKAARGD